MPYDVTPEFTAEKNAETNAPIWLYRVSIDGVEANDVFLAESRTDVPFFKDEDTPEIYQAFPITHEGIGQNSLGEIESLKITVGNALREFQAFIELNDALRGRKVTIRLVFRSMIDDPDAYREEIFYIDSVAANESGASFTLKPKLDILSVVLPRRRYLRDHCAWYYKREGCWLADGDGGWEAPDGFVTPGGDPACLKTITECRTRANNARFGGFPSIPYGRLQ